MRVHDLVFVIIRPVILKLSVVSNETKPLTFAWRFSHSYVVLFQLFLPSTKEKKKVKL